ncbi:hypothetical protein W02_05300 [Nitrospira sp. KM1]|uniref:hypothetical protein n=1 Tax=Nitrospira sp. KM1 TaxID=1936990 RepID=UPI0013A71C84|nr:hypothetical protein [Nitrospira sp. KM1]BCA53390.1 hypothetical protein W02_05300 [Nitrospira sp. KM1]
MGTASRTLVIILLLFTLAGCTQVQKMFALLGPPPSEKSKSALRDSVIERLMPAIRPDVERMAGIAQLDLAKSHDSIRNVPGRFKRRLVSDALQHPWSGLMNLEEQALLIAELAEGGSLALPGLLDVLEAGMDRTSTFQRPVPLPLGPSPESLSRFMLETLEQAEQHRAKALGQLSEDDRQFLFRQAKSFVQSFVPQISSPSSKLVEGMKPELHFADVMEEQVDYSNLIAAAQILARLSNSRWLPYLPQAFPTPLPQPHIPSGITGDVLYVEETSYGLVVIGGQGSNTYELDKRFALVIDVGGDDLYRGMIAASTDADHGNAVVIDMIGNDTYNGDALGLATGRLGVGLLADLAGDDVYQLDLGSGGTGFGGIGILFDAGGNDAYMGGRFTQGAASHGLGLLYDLEGNDRYTSHGFAIGFGGPSGLGALVDVRGNDQYQCGDKYPSAYNAEDAPKGKPGDPMFQYDCFGLGSGAGKRILTNRTDWKGLSMAGGWGLLLDIEGDDMYHSANFSQGHGYFFGAGVLLDLAGNDSYRAARYGHGSSAHYGVGLFNDREGDDQYDSGGPFYNGGVAWDHGVSMMVDSGNGKDRYEFSRTSGLGVADYSGWGLFIDEAGNDQYRVKSGFGVSSEQGIAAFVDLHGVDTYTIGIGAGPPSDTQPSDGKMFRYPEGGIFIDR